MRYDHRRRPVQPETPAPDAFEVQRAEVQPGLSLAYVHEGVGGTPLLLIHGYPETKRIWWRNIGPLVVPGAGHFLQWERADVFNPLLAATFGPGRSR